jgi:hypothetical protein
MAIFKTKDFIFVVVDKNLVKENDMNKFAHTTTTENNALSNFEYEVPHFSMHTLLQSSKTK